MLSGVSYLVKLMVHHRLGLYLSWCTWDGLQIDFSLDRRCECQFNLLNWLKCFVLILLTAVVSTVLDQMLVAQSVHCNLRFAYLITFKAGKRKTKPISRRGERMLSVIRISVRISQSCQGSMENNILLLQWYQLITSLITPSTVSSCPWTCTRSSKHTININKIA